MTAAIHTIIRQYAIPRMNAHRFRATAFEKNEGSKRVLQKLGLVNIHTVQNYFEVDGEMRNLCVFSGTVS
jgi:RimJ/RimL family protein N-acetyltransferase